MLVINCIEKEENNNNNNILFSIFYTKVIKLIKLINELWFYAIKYIFFPIFYSYFSSKINKNHAAYLFNQFNNILTIQLSKLILQKLCLK